jgi:V/A-type H+-transporting ATPase subunit C
MSASGSPLFASAVVTARGGKLLNGDRVRRMIDAPLSSDAVKILYECGYNDAIISENPNNIDGLLSDEMKKTVDFFTGLVSDDALKSVVLKRFDYHNAKVFCKALYGGGVENADAVYPFGLLPPDVIRDSVTSGRYDRLPAAMTAALRALAKEFSAAKPSGRRIDVLLDKALFDDIAPIARRIKNGRIRAYCAAEADTANMLVAARCFLLKFPTADAAEQLIAGGTLPHKKILTVMTGDQGKIRAAFGGTVYARLAATLTAALEGGALGGFEADVRRFLWAAFQNSAVNYYSEEPLFKWYVQKLNELKTVKLILVCKNNGIPERDIRQKLAGMI